MSLTDVQKVALFERILEECFFDYWGKPEWKYESGDISEHVKLTEEEESYILSRVEQT